MRTFFVYVVFGLLITAMSVGAIVYYTKRSVGDRFSFSVPKTVKRLALLGSTPHPTKFLEGGGAATDLAKIKIEDIVDIVDLKDSFEKTLQLCKTHAIDCLVVAYLPVYYAKMKDCLHESITIERFLQNIAPQIINLIEQVRQKVNPACAVTLLLPTRMELDRIPSPTAAQEFYTMYAIKQFPRLSWNNSSLEELFIINTRGSLDQNRDIMRFLRYEYLFEKQIPLRELTIEKDRFHRYL
ncbi:MAG: hypothetical protein UV38_C0001G0031 [candidate division TM6 bacterium GW2011_GWE2_42_60]|nr:MAG: hypothetical protein UV38_C0001G0031 [candidate division TM6 bacterium GW2011_GWE2_42_60]HBY05774.1 hypothetical protein [Candidatus Dependentiae bacterium]